VQAEKGNLNRPEDAWAACSHALTDPWLADRTAPEYGQLRRRFLRLSKKLGRVRTFLSQNGWFVCPLLVSKRSFYEYRLGTNKQAQGKLKHELRSCRRRRLCGALPTVVATAR
jgi:hypothetical protein